MGWGGVGGGKGRTERESFFMVGSLMLYMISFPRLLYRRLYKPQLLPIGQKNDMAQSYHTSPRLSIINTDQNRDIVNCSWNSEQAALS